MASENSVYDFTSLRGRHKNYSAPPPKKKIGIFSFYPHSHCYYNIASTSQARTNFYPTTLCVCRRHGLLDFTLTPDDGWTLRVCAYIYFCRKLQKEGGGGGVREKLSRVIVLNVQTDTDVTPEISSTTSVIRNLWAQLPNRNDRWQLRPMMMMMMIILIRLLTNDLRLRSGRPGIPLTGGGRLYITNRKMTTRTTDWKTSYTFRPKRAVIRRQMKM